MTMATTTPIKPSILAPDFDGVPAAMKAERRWLNWALEYRPDKSDAKPWTKTPKNPKTGGNASSTDPQTWGTFAEAKARHEAGDVDGVGFVLGDGWVGVDIDSCATQDGQVEKHALEIRDRLNTYGEFSVTGTGLHFIARGALPAGRRRKGKIEMYDAGRYFTVTGARLGGSLTVVAERTAELAALHADLLADEKPKQKAAPPTNGHAPHDADIIRKASESKSGDKFKRLWDGDTSQHDGDDSAADLAFCSHLAFWCGAEQAAIDRLFRQSGLYREKWEREDYRGRTIGKAIAGCSEFYKWNGNGQAPNGKLISADELREFGIEREPGDDPVEPQHVNGFTRAAWDNAAPLREANQGVIDEQHAQAQADKFPMMTAKELAAGDFSGNFIIEDWLAALEFCILVGPKKSLKTTLALYMACCIALGRPLFGIFKVNQRLRVGFFSGESGPGTLQDALRRVAINLGRSPSDIDGLLFTFQVPQLDADADVAAIEKKIVEHDLHVVFLDCFYRMLGEAAENVANLFQMGRLLGKLMDLQLRTGCTVVLLHHCPKHAPYAEPELDNAAFAGSAEAARQWILISRREAYDPDNCGHHRLWISAGGSMGHSELLALNIDEGSRKDRGGRRLDIEVIKAGEARAEAAAAGDEVKEERRVSRKQTELQQDRETICGILQTMSKPDTHTEVRNVTGLSTPRFAKAIASLTVDKTVMVLADAVLKGNNRPYDGYWLATRKAEIPQRAATGSLMLPDASHRNRQFPL